MSDWSYDGLWAKALLYAKRAMNEDRDGPLFPLWATLALEFVARSSLAKIHPALLADPREGENLLHAFGFTAESTPRSVPALTVFKRCRRVVDEFTDEDFKKCMGLTERRNAELHSGTAAFEGLKTGLWLSDYFRILGILLKAQGKSLADLFGEDEAAGGEKMVLASQEKAIGDVKKSIAEAKKQFEDLAPAVQEERRKAAAAKSKIQPSMDSQAVECPACGSEALIRGEKVTVKEPKLDDDTGTLFRQRVFLPTAFACSACGLSLKGHGPLHAAGLGGNYTVMENMDPAEYFGIEQATEADFEAYVDQWLKDQAAEAEYGND
jgi:predicted RNA-binding Zn-ribbon protein involved in translation (DUF1610 family)